VLAIIALLISILLPSLARARELAKRSVCASNMKNIGNGLVIYANSNADALPAAGPFTPMSVLYVAKINDQADSNLRAIADNNSKNSNTKNLYRLVRDGDFATKSLVCPSSDDQPMQLEDPACNGCWDFGEYNQISYGYQVPYGTYGLPNVNIGGSDMPWAADKGPYGGVHFGSFGWSGAPWPPTLDPNAPPDDWRPYNSPNHGGSGNGEGQNVLYADAHASFSNKPTAGVSSDNIYTAWNVASPGTIFTDKKQITNGLPPGPQNTGGGNEKYPMAHTDALIYP
jgi:hypothetical protein